MLMVRFFNIGTIPSLNSSQGIKILYTEAGASEIKDDKIYQILQALLPYRNQKIKEDILFSLFENISLDLQGGQKFLLEDKRLLSKLPDPHNPNFQDKKIRFLIYSDNESMSKLLYEFLEKDLQPSLTNKIISEISFIDDQSFPHKDKNNLSIIIVYQSRYNPAGIKKLYQQFALSEPSTIFITSYILHDRLIVDAPYSYSFGVPCHYCHLEYILKFKNGIDNQNSNVGWVNLVNLLSNYQSLSLMSFHVAFLETSFIAYQLSLLIKHLTIDVQSHHSRTGKYHDIALKTGQMISDLVPHSPTCQCISGIW